MTEDLNLNLRPSSGPFKSPKEIVKFYSSIDGWQEVLPKTDNTYSPGSKYYKYEVSPGIPFIPNMSRLPLKSYEKTPLKYDFLKDSIDYNFISSHIKRNLFTSTTYKHLKIRNRTETHTEIEEIFSTTQSKTSKVIKNVYQSVKIFINFIISYFISIIAMIEIHESVMEVGSHIINTTFRKIINWVHLATITMVHYDLVIITTIKKKIYNLIGPTRINNLVIPILFSALLLFLSVAFLKYTIPLNILVWQDSWTNFLISPFISIVNLITSIYQIFSSTIYFVLDLITVSLASSIMVIQLFGQYFLNVFRYINPVVDSATRINTVYINQQPNVLPFDYDLLAKKIIASEKFQHVLTNYLNISQSDLVKLQNPEFQQLFKSQLQEMNTENLNWINDQLEEQQFALKNINKEISGQEKKMIKLIENKISDLQNIVTNLINNFETLKSKSESLRTSTEHISKRSCVKDDWHSIVNYIDHYVNKTLQSALSLYDADKTGMVDYALESAGAIVLGTRCTQTKSSTAALTMFGIPLWFISNGPRLAIQPGVYPGQCWAFIGAKGFLVLKLSNTIRVTGFTIEHLPRSLSEDGHIRSAPKDFSVWGLKHETDSDGKLLGNYQFKVDGPSLQYFSAMETDIFTIVELRIESNHGHEEYTCLYRVRIHGELA